jgi:adenylate kinase
MRIVLLGPPASGKGTQADVLTKRLSIPKISTGDMLREARTKGTPLGKEAESYMNSGRLVPDSVVIGLVAERISLPDADAGFILDGFPRTVLQAEALQVQLLKVGRPLDCVAQIDVPRELLMERATLRRMDRQTGQIYHLKYNPPPAGVEVIHRADDQEETVKKRLDEYDTMTAALIPFYSALGLLRRVEGAGSPDDVTSRLTAAIGK